MIKKLFDKYYKPFFLGEKQVHLSDQQKKAVMTIVVLSLIAIGFRIIDKIAQNF